MFIPVADAHGLVEDKILKLIYPLFDVFIIHTFKGQDHEILLQKHIGYIRQSLPGAFIIVVSHDETKQSSDFSTSEDAAKNVTFIHIAKYNDLLDIARANLR
jgi:hypothetical protein